MRAPPTQKSAIVNADDFGFAPGLTEGILRAHAHGIVTSTTVTVNMPGAEQALERLEDHPGLGLGLHLNLCQGPPLSQEGAALAGADGLMNRSAAGLIRACLFRPRLLRAMEAECEAQIRRLLDCGRPPTHLDSHRHIHGYPPVFARVARLARRYDIPFIRWHREHLPGRGWPKAPAKQRRSSRVLNWFGAVNARIAPELRATEGTWGLAHTGLIDADWLIRAAEAMPPGRIELMVHPGLAEDLPAATTRLRESRRAELAALCDPAVRDAFARNGIELIHYGHLRHEP